MATTLTPAISALPNEILDSVFRFLVDEFGVRDARSLISVFCACRRWYEVGRPLIWTDVVLNDFNFSRFTSAVTSTNVRLVRSLTVKFDLSDALYAAMEWPKHTDIFLNLARLRTAFGQILQHLTRLETFSITLANSPTNAPPSFTARDLLHMMLQGLPPSTENLNIDIYACNAPWDDSQLAIVLKTLFHQLRHVKLSVGTLLCATLFQKIQDLGSSFGVKPSSADHQLDPESHQHATRFTPSSASECVRNDDVKCPSPPVFRYLESLIIDCAELDHYSWMPHIDYSWKNQATIALVLAAHAALDAKQFPAIRKFSVFNILQMSPVVTRSFDAIIEVDLVGGQVHANPLIPCPRRPHTVDPFVRYKDVNGDLRETIGDSQAILATLTNWTWVESVGGCIFPAASMSRRRTVEGNYNGKIRKSKNWLTSPGSIPLFDGNVMLSRRAGFLVHAEKSAGRALLTTRTTNGIFNVKPLVHEFCQEEIVNLNLLVADNGDEELLEGMESDSDGEMVESNDWEGILEEAAENNDSEDDSS